MKHRALHKHKTRSTIHIQWSHEDTPMHPFSSSPQWLSGDMPAIILTLSSNVFNISKKKNEKFSRFKNVPLFRAFGSVESAESWKCFLLLAERRLVYHFPDLKLKSQRIHLVCLKCNETRIIQSLSITVSRDARLCFK